MSCPAVISKLIEEYRNLVFQKIGTRREIGIHNFHNKRAAQVERLRPNNCLDSELIPHNITLNQRNYFHGKRLSIFRNTGERDPLTKPLASQPCKSTILQANIQLGRSGKMCVFITISTHYMYQFKFRTKSLSFSPCLNSTPTYHPLINHPITLNKPSTNHLPPSLTGRSSPS